jgi:16S rRNA (guanine966-N2)-methyltransferase
MTRIISGLAGGRRLLTPTGSTTRPTTDRVREALFSRLDHRDLLAGSRVLDLYAGSGALGLEAASRGASAVLLVERDTAVAELARRNVAALGLTGVSVRAEPVERLLLAGPGGSAFDLVLADPPYDLGEETLAGVLAQLVQGGWPVEGAVVVLERSTRSPQPRWPERLEPADERRYGETRLWFAQARPAGAALLGSRHG